MEFGGLAAAAIGTPRASSVDAKPNKPGDAADAARGQPAKWLGRGSPQQPMDKEYFALTAFMYEGPEGCATQPLPAKTSEPVLDAAKCLLTPSLTGSGWTLLELGSGSWFRHASQCHFSLALTAGGRSHVLIPFSAVYEGTDEALKSLNQAALHEICNGVRRKLDSETWAANSQLA